MSHYYSQPENQRLPSGLFFRVDQAEQPIQPPSTRGKDIEQSGTAYYQVNYDEFVVPEYRSTKDDDELYLPLLKVSVEVDVVATIAWTKLTQTFTNQAVHPIKEATYCFPLYEKSAITAFTCTMGSGKVLEGVVKPKLEARAEFKEGIARRRVAALLEEHTPEVFETSVGNIPAQTTIKIEISYITELKADLSGHGILVTIPTSVAPRYGTPPRSTSGLDSPKSLAVPHENGLEIQIQISSPVPISKIESQTHPVSVEMGSRGHTTTRNIRDLFQNQTTHSFDPKNARAALSDRSASLGKDFVLLVQSRDGKSLASRALLERHPKTPNHSALMISINLRDLYTPNVVTRKQSNEIVFLADRSGSMQDKMEALKTAMRFFLKSLPDNCTFNICSFGNDYALMWPTSRPYSQENVDAALSYITMNFAADMGGTEILSGLRHVVQKSNSSVNTEIIILTDGEVWDSENVFNFIRETRASGPKAQTRFFALGIGEAVSHHLIEGIGRYGGGLAEVVPVASAGDWKGRVIRTLEAALMPSTWKVEIIMDDFAITSADWEERACIQAPHHIPDFHAFTRSSVYFILNQQLGAKTIRIKATAISGEAVTTELPIETVESRHACVYALAAKAVLGDLESGQSRLHDTKANDNAGKIEKDIDDLARSEGEKLGTEWSISSKWTSFVVVDNNSASENPSRWYQAEKSDLAELTRPRFNARNFSSSSSRFATSYGSLGVVASDKAKTRGRMGARSSQTLMQCASPDMPMECPSPQIQPEQLKSSMQRVEMQEELSEELGPGGEHRAEQELEYRERSQDRQGLWTRRGIWTQQRQESVAVRELAMEQEAEQAELDRENRAFQLRRARGAKLYTAAVGGGRDGWRVGEARNSYAMMKGVSMNQPHKEEEKKGKRTKRSLRASGLNLSARGELPTSSKRDFDSTRRHIWSLRVAESEIGVYPDRSLRGQTTQEITLDVLVDAQTAAGNFNLDSELRVALDHNFKSAMRKSGNDWFLGALGSRESAENILKALDTAVSIVWIEARYAESRELWGLAVQKARGFLKTVVPEEESTKELFQILRGELLNSNEAGKGEREGENKDGDEKNRGNEGSEGNKMSSSISVEKTPSKKSFIRKIFPKFKNLGEKK